MTGLGGGGQVRKVQKCEGPSPPSLQPEIVRAREARTRQMARWRPCSPARPLRSWSVRPWDAVAFPRGRQPSGLGQQSTLSQGQDWVELKGVRGAWWEQAMRKCERHSAEPGNLSVWQESSIFLDERDSMFGPDCETPRRCHHL